MELKNGGQPTITPLSATEARSMAISSLKQDWGYDVAFLLPFQLDLLANKVRKSEIPNAHKIAILNLIKVAGLKEAA